MKPELCDKDTKGTAAKHGKTNFVLGSDGPVKESEAKTAFKMMQHDG
jgi:hypothetical protein